MISPSQRPLPDNTQHSQQTNIHALGGIRTHVRSRRAAVDLRLRPRGYWDRLTIHLALVYVIEFEGSLRAGPGPARKLPSNCMTSPVPSVQLTNS